MPNVDIRGKLASMNVKVKSARMPSPHELRESYLNSGFHKSFKQPLAVRTRVEDVDTQKARQLLTEKMWVYDEGTEQIINKEISFSPGLYKIFDEVLVNAADNKQRDKKMDTIKIEIDQEKNEIKIYNNGKCFH